MTGSVYSDTNRRLLFVLSNLAIFTIGLGLAVRASIAGDLQADLFDQIDVARSATMVGEVLAATFAGFAITLLFGSAIVDLVGMRSVLILSALGYVVGSIFVLMATIIDPSRLTYQLVYAGFLLTGLGWGGVEVATNPLVATIYKEEKTHRLNILHAWWPAGIVMGGLVGILLTTLDISWKANLIVLMIPAVLLLVLVRRAEFPVTERVEMGVSYKEMFHQLLRSPGFFIWFFCMMGTVTAELAPSQWVDLALTNIVGMSGIWVLIYVNSIIFAGRHFAGSLVSRFSTPGLLFLGCLLAAPGLYLLSIAETPLFAFFAATLWAIGICYFYPTMLGAVAERYPEGGALMIGLMGFAGGLASYSLLPWMGALFDQAKLEAAGGLDAFNALNDDQVTEVIRVASVESFQIVAFIPLILLPIFGLLWARETAKAVVNR
tara:strand:+ start:526 stop:1827 length:1302 start_codon:yes stop_codon:yes gene_type:complete